MIQARQQAELTTDEQNAIRTFFLSHPELGEVVNGNPSPQLLHSADRFEDYLKRWGVVVNSESLKAAYQNLAAVEGVLKIKSAAELKWEQASKQLPPHVLDALDQGMRQCHLVTDGDEGFENKTNLLGYLQGREISTATIARAAEYCGGRGIRIHWQVRPSQSRENRGHAHLPGERWAPKSETNRSFLPSHSSNPRLNGQLEREQRERERQRFHPDSQIEADIAMVNRYYNSEIEKAVAEGRTHTERARIAQAAQQTPGGPRLQAEAAQKEAALIRQDRERGR